MSTYMNFVSNTDILVTQRLEEQAMQIHDLKARIAANEVQKHEAIKALSMRLARIEERLGITEPVVAPGD